MEYNKYYWLNEDSRTFLSRGYITESPEQRIKDIAIKAEKYLNIKGFAEKFEDYMARGFYSLSTPVWINFGKQKGLPISCYGSNIDDNLCTPLSRSDQCNRHQAGASRGLKRIKWRSPLRPCERAYLNLRNHRWGLSPAHLPPCGRHQNEGTRLPFK